MRGSRTVVEESVQNHGSKKVNKNMIVAYNQGNNVQVDSVVETAKHKPVYDTIDILGSSRETTISGSSPASDAGPVMILRIFVGAFVVCGSCTIDPEREGAADIPAEPRAAFDLPLLPSAGADIEVTDFGTAILSESATLALVAAEAIAMVVAKSDSLSPTHERANQRPPAMPRISRFAILHWRTLAPVRSKGCMGANPVPIFGGGWTGKGFEGSGYTGKGRGTLSPGSSGAGGGGGSTSSGSGDGPRETGNGEEGAVIVCAGNDLRTCQIQLWSSLTFAHRSVLYGGNCQSLGSSARGIHKS